VLHESHFHKKEPCTVVAMNGESLERGSRLQELTQLVAELKLSLESMERERDFYFIKLREMEILIQSGADASTKEELATKIQDILYSTQVNH
jgi:microtubule-associated protein, RP/EB family